MNIKNNIPIQNETETRTVTEEPVEKIRTDFNSLPINTQEQIVETNTVLMESLEISRFYAGPVPPPSVLVAYNQADPNAANRIIAMSEKEQDSRIENERFRLEKVVESQRRSQYMGFFIVSFSIIGSFILLWMGKTALGLTTLGSSAIGLVGALNYSKLRNLVSSPTPDDSSKEKNKNKDKESNQQREEPRD